jgi:probable rRNA maturation factor
MLVSIVSHREPEPLDFGAFERLAQFALQMEGVPEGTELSIALVDEDEIAALNERYRGKSGPTDVLSFGCDEPCPTPGDEPITLGDVVIAPSLAERQAEDLGHSVEHELDVLLVHGVLHLLGYDHEDDDDAAAMEARQAAILDAYADE